nr:MAG TPA: capsid protein [Genomoviridae sp.]
MARTRYSGRRSSRTSRRTTRRKAPRRYATKKRTYRKKRSMTKRILNVASVKKRDTMVPISNPTLDPYQTRFARPAEFQPGRPIPDKTPAYTYVVPWIPTCRQVSSNNGPAAQTSRLTSSNPYYVGLSEKISISTTGAAPW